MSDQPKKLTKEDVERKMRESDEKKNKIIALVEEYVQSECPSILLIAHNKQGIILDIPLKGLPHFANEKLLMTEVLESHMARRVIMGLEHKIGAIVEQARQNIVKIITEQVAAKLTPKPDAGQKD